MPETAGTDLLPDTEVEVAWESEILDRIRAVDESRVKGVAYEDVMREAEKRLAP